MDVREKLVELLSYFADGYSVEIRNIAEGQRVCEIADHLIARGVTILDCKRDCANCWKTKMVTPMWISVKDRLPEEGGYYLICQKDKSWFDEVIQTARWNKVTQSFRGAQAGCFMEFVTHWMPLPQPPKGE